MGRAFTCIGLEVLDAGSGKEALKLLDQHDAPVTAVVLDRTMPAVGGDRPLIEVCARLPILRTSGDTCGNVLYGQDDKTTSFGMP